MTIEEASKELIDKLLPLLREYNLPAASVTEHEGTDRARRFFLQDAIPIITKQALEDNDSDPQAELFGWFIEHGWTPPAELDDKIKQAQEEERKRITDELDKYFELAPEDDDYLRILVRRFLRELKGGSWKGRDPSQEGGG